MKTKALALAVLLASCSSGGSSQKALGFYENLSVRGDMVARTASVYESPNDAMPTIEYFGKGIAPFRVSDQYVRGIVVSVEPGIGMNWTLDENGEATRQLEFGSSDALVNTVHLVISPVKMFGPNGQSGDRGNVKVGVALTGAVDLRSIRSELINREIAAILVDSNPVFSYSPGLKSILEDGNYIGSVENGTIKFMVLGAHEGSVPSVPLGSIESEVKRRISVHRENGVLVQD